MKKLNLSKLIKIIAIFTVVGALGYGGYSYYLKNLTNGTIASANEMTAKATKGDISVYISGTGTVEAISKYNIVSLVQGDILSSPFEEGQEVKAGDLLYKIDESDLAFTIEKAKNNIEKKKLGNKSTTDSIKDLEVYAPFEGEISNITLKEGETVNSGAKIATLTDNKHLTATVQFNEDQIKNVQEGMKCKVLVGDFMSYLDGSIKYIGNTLQSSTDNRVYTNVGVEFENPGALKENMEVYASIKVGNTDIISPGSGKIQYARTQSIVAKTGGTIKKINVRNNEWVSSNQKILDIENDSLNVSNTTNQLDLKEEQLSLESNIKKLEDYTIESPISGKVVTKSYKAGDKVNNSSTVLMTVADFSKMIFTINVDELDIAKVTLGQKVNVTSDAIADSTFVGEVTSKPLEGTTSNGVTTYAVKVTISEPKNLMPGMNVNATILVESKKDVLCVPMDAISKSGNKYYVNVKSTDITNTQSTEKREVTVGINNDTIIEILSGLNYGDTVYYTGTTSTSKTTAQQGQMGGMPGMGGGGEGGPPPGGE